MNLYYEALKIANKAHKEQLRKQEINNHRLPYITHPVEVSKQLWKMGFGDAITLACGLLHDVIEDTGDRFADEIAKLGHPEIVNVVKDLTFSGGNKKDYIKSFSNPNMNPRSVVVKAADRICNIKDYTLKSDDDAAIYMDKADAIFTGICLQQQNITRIWSGQSYNSLYHSWINLADELRKFSKYKE